jgi:pimeloyl-ACP methyl ester carboxylesterase
MAHPIGFGRWFAARPVVSVSFWVVIAALGACRSDARPEQGAPAIEPEPTTLAPAAPACVASAQIAPLVVSDLTSLAVPGYREAVLTVPDSKGTSRPVVVAVHGNYDHVEPFCETWAQITSHWAFVLCPRGPPRLDAGVKEDRWTFGWNGRDLEREIEAGLQALKHRHGDRVANGPVIFAGFSLGAILGADIVLWKPSRYTRAVLVEGGTTNWSLATAKTFSKGGGGKMMFACGQDACVRETRTGLHWLEVVGVDARTAYAGTIGHTYEGIVAEELTRQWPWLTDGDPRWPSALDPAGPLAVR